MSASDPIICWDRGNVIPGKPFVLSFDWDDTPASLYLTPTQLEELLASGHKAERAWRQANCRHGEWKTSFDLDLGDGRVKHDCRWCDAEVIEEADGTYVAVAEAGAT